MASWLAARPRTVLVLFAIAPFVPVALEFLRVGIPDDLLTGDPATLAIRTHRAAHFQQLLGPYSRFLWSHPGPAYFYIAAPVYEAFHRHGRALNLFALVVNLASAVAIALSARKLRGFAFALTFTTLLAIYECLAPQFRLADEWNPFVLLLPFALLSLLCVRLAGEGLGVLPGFVFLASAIVQTHVGYLPVVIVLSALALTFRISSRFSHFWDRGLSLVRGRARRMPPSPAAPAHGRGSRRSWPHPSILAAVAIFILLWLPPAVEAVTAHPSNVELLYRFFGAPHAAEHDWAEVAVAVCGQLSMLPLGVVRWIGCPVSERSVLLVGLGIGQACLVLLAFAEGVRRGDRGLTQLSCVVLTAGLCSFLAVHAVRGPLTWHVLLWISIVDLLALGTLAAVLLELMGAGTPGARQALLTVALAVVLGFCVARNTGRVDLSVPPRDEGAERLARAIRDFLVKNRVPAPTIHLASHDTWPTLAAVVLYLYADAIPIFVERDWLFLVGSEFRAPSTTQTPLWIGDRSYCEKAEQRTDLKLLATVGDRCMYITPE